VATVATHATFSKQVLGDTASLTKVISDVLSGDVLDKLEQLLILGDGAGDQIEGMLPQAMPIAISATTPADAISEALATMTNSGYSNLVVLMNPLKWHQLRTERVDGGAGVYLVGSWLQPATPSMWQAPVVTSSSMPVGQALVIDVQKVRLLDREQPSVLISSEHADNFTRNLVTILAELRAGLAIYDSGAVGLVELPNNSSP
jgi:HK97 family phage major capsid protein